jgi:hypothetical protein
MQTSHFQLGLIATLAVCLGFSLSLTDAVGYPAGAAVSMGSNPVVSFGGTRNSSGTDAIGPAPTDQDLVITDISLSGNSSHSTHHACRWTVSLESETGATLGVFKTWSQVNYSSYSIGNENIFVPLQSGMHVPAGESLGLVVEQDSGGTTCSIAYTLSGYYAQP